MGTHPANLALRFLLELTTLVALGAWGWSAGGRQWKWVLVVLVPVAAAAAWGTFAVPEDPSRSGAAPVPVPGVVRLVLELGFFAAGVLALRSLGWERSAVFLGVVVFLHYLASYDRVEWLVRR